MNLSSGACLIKYLIQSRLSCKVVKMLCYSLFGMFGLQEAMKKKLEIQKQKQELLNKQIQEQKVTSNIPP